MHLQLDPIGGIAGDMFIAAVLDAWPELAAGTLESIRRAGVPERFDLAVVAHRDRVLCGQRFVVEEPPGHAHGAVEHAHHHHPFGAIVRRLERSTLDAAVRERALAIFGLLAEAEAHVHGVPLDEVEFHEVGAWDSIADIVGAAFLLESLDVTSWSLGPLPLGRGRVRTAHGQLPVPPPATALLTRGFEFVDDGVGGERVTPTGAAILAHLRAALGPPAGSLREATLARIGTGFGTRVLPGVSNVLRVLGFESVAARADDRVGLVQFEVDDQSGEDLALAIESLRARDGVLDVLQIPAIGKKGRMVCHVQVLCRREALAPTIDACFQETTTIGLRWSVTARATLARDTIAVEAAGRTLGVKLAARPDGQRSAKVEADDLRGVAGHAERERLRQRAEDEAARLAAAAMPGTPR